MTSQIFFAYGGTPEATRETVSRAAARLGDNPGMSVETWEQLRVGGRLVVGQITDAIQRADVVCAEVSTMNPNVLFEVGYAIAQEKPIQLLLDTTDDLATQNWKTFGLLSQVGYLGYSNSDEIKTRLMNTLAAPDVLTPLWNDLVGTTLVREVEHSVFYLPLNHATDASRTLTRRLTAADRRGWELISADHSELGLAPLAWYVQQIYKTDVAVLHLSAPRRSNSAQHNARAAFLSGLAHGLGKRLLMVANEELAPSFDFQDLLHSYASSRQLADIFNTWFEGMEATHGAAKAESAQRSMQRLRLRSELQSLNFYEYVAEQEISTLGEYFVRTREFEEVLTSPSIVFVGRKGVGKTANMLQAAETLRADRRNLVCVIKPTGYELQGLLQVLERFRGRESRTYLLENMWKFLLYSEIAKTAIEEAEERPAGLDPSTPLGKLSAFIDSTGMSLREDFAVRLESVVQALLDRADPSIVGVADSRDNIGSALGGVLLRDLRQRLEVAVGSHHRVAILVDNLDKAWDRQADLDDLATLILGLLTAVGRVSAEFRPGARRDDATNFTLAVFLRSDVYEHMLRVAREPDKIRTAHIGWTDPDLLFRVLERRYVESRGSGEEDADRLWRDFFCPTVDGLTTREHLFRRVLPRPRDLLYLVNAAVANAVNANRERVDQQDVKRAELAYSQFAFEAALVPDGISSETLEELLFEFAGGTSLVTAAETFRHCDAIGIGADMQDGVLQHLLSIEFLGRQTGKGRFSFGAEGKDARLADALARRHARDHGIDPLYGIHPAFWPYLEISPLAGAG